SGQDYTLQSTSPAIDSATTTIYTADYLGNTFYGTPDTGAYEYQPPHDIAPVTPDTIDIGAGARIYGDGKFRDLGTINSNAAHLKITPSGGSFPAYGSTAKRPAWLDVTNITNWSNTHKTWTESNASSSSMVTDHVIGDLHANKSYTITITGATASSITGINGTTCSNGVCQSNGSGNLSFRYSGGYSDHTFDMLENPIAPTAPVLGTPTAVSVPLSWTTGGGNENVYVLEKSLDGGSSFAEVATVNVPTTNYTFTGLSPNNQYQFRVAAGNGSSTSTYATSSLIYTLANQASAPTLGTATTSTIPLYINANGNPVGTTYAVYDATDSRYFTSAGAITATPTFFTSSSWSGVARGLSASSYYTFQVIARNGDGVNSATSTGASATTVSAAVNLSKTTVSTVEGGATDSYTIVLNAQPTSTVNVIVSPDSNQTVSTSTISFTSANWNVPVTVTVTAVNDHIAQGTHTGIITHTVTNSGVFNGVAVSNVTNTITDNDTAGVNLSKTIVYTYEGIASDTYTIVLNSQPTSTVQITVSPDSSSIVSPSTIIFNSTNWNVPVTVTVTAVVRNQGGHIGTITHTASSLSMGYRNITVASVTNSITGITAGTGGGGGGGGSGGQSGPLPGQQSLGIALDHIEYISDGQAKIWIKLNADPSSVRGYAISTDSTLSNTSLLAYIPLVSIIVPTTPSPATIYVRYYSTSGQPSNILSLQVDLSNSNIVVVPPPPTETPPPAQAPAQTLDPSNLQSLLDNLSLPRNIVMEDLVLKQVRADAKEFKLILNAGQEMAIRNFIVYGISPATVKLGRGERRAVARDYMETVHRADFVWSDIERLTTGLIPLVRNLALERQNVNKALPVFLDIFGHTPNFKVAKENLAWNTLLYRIRFTRDMAKESAGLKVYFGIYKHYPTTPFGWSVVRVLGYVR
ncbi:MAG: fibronectin type III domain-containing protein, partial [Dehalococcoidales bacterium]|nr:fibronectin type III domain-containing protein [Dehalococcoidales bacterium]